MFRPIDKLRNLFHDIKSFVKKDVLKAKIDGKKYNVIGKIGMYHLAIDVTGTNIKIGDLVYLDINPIHVDSKVRREYI